MPCNAISTVSARVALRDELANILTKDQIVAVVQAFLKEKFGPVSNFTAGQFTSLTFSVEGFIIKISTSGEVQVLGTYGQYSQAATNRLASEISDILEQAAGLVLKDKIQLMASQLGFIESVTETQAGRVITLEI